ncbi:MAG: putative transposase DNA-binding domain protein [Candidatus Methanoperedens nitroreducens]|uniref:Putative transposase DNA-binding domain protein n=1 Tax=Candidatus Methanoperedens nitratireducens TaxID=1392998 RepID=A0A0P8A777_9EURY|nr:MAG: putative transposase DNA-binding domain protein [Candidatus Methanoperedens sp. BLZ1]
MLSLCLPGRRGSGDHAIRCREEAYPASNNTFTLLGSSISIISALSMAGKTLRKCIILNILELTSTKQDIIDNLFSEYLHVLNTTLDKLPSARSSLELHHLTYSTIRESSFLPSDIVEEARKDVWAKRKTIKNGFKKCSIRLNKRWFRFVNTDRGNPCFKITYSPKKTVSIPVRLNAHWNRLNSFLAGGWMFDNISLLNGNRIAVILEKISLPAVNNRRYILGVDVGSSTLAAVTVYDTQERKVVKQLYLGQDMAERQNWYLERRAMLQHLTKKGSDKDNARKHLRKLKHDQSSFVNTRSGQVSKEIMKLAQEYEASVAIENLNLRAKKKINKSSGEKKINRKARKKINRIPFGKLRDYLKSNCEKSKTPLDMIDAYHTSKWCPYCGSVNPGHDRSNYALYTCKTCGITVNSDRKSSLAVAVKSLLERNINQALTKPDSFQISWRRPPVTVVGLFRPCPSEARLSCAVHDIKPADGMPRT